jgi:hypothetical protein
MGMAVDCIARDISYKQAEFMLSAEAMTLIKGIMFGICLEVAYVGDISTCAPFSRCGRNRRELVGE